MARGFGSRSDSVLPIPPHRTIRRRFFEEFGMMLFHDSVHDLLAVSVLYLSVSVFLDRIGIIFVKFNTPFKEEL